MRPIRSIGADPYANVQVRPVAADERSVNDSVDPASPRVAHDPVNDSGGTPAATTATTPPAIPAAAHAASNPDPAGFRFNLDDALARLSEPHHPIPRFNWSALSPTSTDALPPQGPMHTGPMAAGAQAAVPSPASTRSMFPDQDSRVRPLTQPTLDPLPEIREATQVGPGATPHWSTIPAAAPPPAALVLPAPPVAAAPMIVSGTDAFAAGVSGFSPDSAYSPTPDVMPSPHVGDGMPRLPESEPAAAPPMAMMTSATAAAPTVRSASASTARGRQKAKRRRLRKLVLIVLAPGRALRRSDDVRP